MKKTVLIDCHFIHSISLTYSTSIKLLVRKNEYHLLLLNLTPTYFILSR